MIVNYLNIKSVFPVPLKTDSKLVVNPDAVLILSVSLKRLKSISPEILEILQASSRSNPSQLNPGLLMQLRWQQLARLL